MTFGTKNEQKGPRNLYVQPDDVVVPIRETRDADGKRTAELGEPILARDLWKEQNHG